MKIFQALNGNWLLITGYWQLAFIQFLYSPPEIQRIIKKGHEAPFPATYKILLFFIQIVKYVHHFTYLRFA